MSGILRICCIFGIATSTLSLNAPNEIGVSSPEQPNYVTNGYEDPNIYWFRPARNFLSVMANNDRFAEYFVMYLNDDLLTFWDVLNQADAYGAVIVLPIIGILFALATMVTGIVYCSCRMCGNCGGKREQDDSNSTNKCRRITLMALMGFFLTITLVGLIYTFAANPIADKPIITTYNSLINGVSDVFTFANFTSKEVSIFWVFGANVTLAKLKEGANDLESRLETNVTNEYGASGLNDATELTSKLNEIYYKMGPFDTSLKALGTDLISSETYVSSFSDEVEQINVKILAATAGVCEATEPLLITTALTINVMQHAEDSVDASVVLVQQATKYDLQSIAADIENRYSNYQIIGLDTKVQDLILHISEYSDKMETSFKYIDDILQSMVSQAGVANETLHGNIAVDFLRLTDNAIVYSRLTISLIMLLIFLLLLIGFAGGTIFYRSKIRPTKRSTPSNSFGKTILVGVSFAIIFSALFWVVTAVFYVPGCMMELFCRPFFSDSSNFTNLDNIVSASGADFAGMFGAGDGTLLSNILLSCQANMSAYDALNLESQAQLEAILNNKTINSQFINDFQNLIMKESDIKILPADLMQVLAAYQSASIVDLEELNTALDNSVKPSSYVEWETIFDSNCNCGTPPATSCDTVKSDVQKFYSTSVNHFHSNMIELSSSVDEVLGISSELKILVDRAIILAESLEILDSNAVKTYNQTLLVSYFEFMNTLEELQNSTLTTVTDEIGRCLPLWNVYHYSRMKVCRVFVEEWNGYWFNLGVCLFFLIGAIVTGVLLSKYFLRMTYLDPNRRNSDSSSIINANVYLASTVNSTNQHPDKLRKNGNKAGISSPVYAEEPMVKIPRLPETRKPHPNAANNAPGYAIWHEVLTPQARKDSFRKPRAMGNSGDYYY